MKYPFLGPNGQKSADLLGLSMRGAVAICQFPEEVHGECFDQMASAMSNTKKPIQTPVKLYIYLCNQYCISHFIERDHSLIAKYTAQYNINLSEDDYLPVNERVKVALPIEDLFSRRKDGSKGQQQPRKINPTPWPTPKLYKFSAPGVNRNFDDIAEAIQAKAYVAAGLEGLIVINLGGKQFTFETFEQCALLKIAEMLVAKQKYVLDIPKLFARVDEMIEYTITVSHQDRDYIKDLNVEEAQAKAHQAIAEYAPKLLRYFNETKPA
jgi:hypothetical protein